MNKLKQVIAGLLVTLNILTLMPMADMGRLIDEAYATSGSQVGSGDGDKTVSGSGTWATYSTNVGYRFWLMDEEGNFVSDAGVADIIYQKPPSQSTREYKWTFNVKTQPWTGQSAQNKYKMLTFDELNSKGFTGSLPRPIIAPNGGDYKGQGEQFRKWMTDGERIIQAGGGGGGGRVTYTYTGKKPGSSGKPSSGSSTSGGNTETKPTTPTVGTISQQMGAAYSNAMATARANKSNWTRNYAVQYVNACLRQTCDRLCQGLTGTERRPIIDTMNSYSDMIDRELPYDFKTADASHLIDTGTSTAYLEVPKSTAVTEQDDGTLILDLFDIAYGTGDGGHALKEKGNIYPLLNNNELFNLDNLPIQVYNTEGDGKRFNLATIAANKLKLIIEPIVWFQPATISGGKIGTSPSWWFYGTPTTYASMMEYANGRKGYWYDGGSGGWYSNTLNRVAAQCLYLDGDLATTTDERFIKEVHPNNKVIANSSLKLTDQGYAMHYVIFEYDGPGLPSTHTYDYNPDPNPIPHPAPDPTPPKIPIVPSEPEEPGDPIVPEDHPDYKEDPDPGYKNITRNIHIIKVYDIIHIDGTIEHVETHDRDFNPGTIKVEHEEDYKCVGYFTSEVYYGYLEQPYVNPVPTELEWKDFRENPSIPINSEIFWETEYENVSEKKGKDVAGTVKIGLAADPEFDADNPVDEKHPDGQPKNGYYDTTLYVHLVKKEKIPETSTWDEPTYPPAGNPPVVPPNAPPDPFNPPITDPETDPPSETYSHYRIVKVYETEDEATGNIDTDAILYRFPTNPIVYIQDEAQKGKPDYSYHLIEWRYGDEYNGIKWNKNNESPKGTDWDSVVAGVNAKGAGTTEEKVDLIDKDNVEETVTLYVRLRRKVGDRIPGEIIIEQSQISKVIHSNDKNIGGRFGDYRFAMTIGNFRESHTAYYNHCCAPGDCRYHTCRCVGHTCLHEMPGRAGDNKVNFNFDLISDQHDLEIPKGVHVRTDPKVYGHSGSAVDALSPGQDYPETISTLYASDNKFYYSSDGKDAKVQSMYQFFGDAAKMD